MISKKRNYSFEKGNFYMTKFTISKDEKKVDPNAEGDLSRAVKLHNPPEPNTPTVVDAGGESWAQRRKRLGIKE
jgi:hypothetical protein